MFNFDHIVRTASAAVFSLMLTTIAVGATIAPVSAAPVPAPQFAAPATGGTANG